MILGAEGTNRLRKSCALLVSKDYWIATNRHDLTAEEVVQVYKLRWNIETFFGWWKRHLKVYQENAEKQKPNWKLLILNGCSVEKLIEHVSDEDVTDKCDRARR